jgi:3-phenylpropionate/trans-cinnamate dioxygenase ferredoxin reductase subunit
MDQRQLRITWLIGFGVIVVAPAALFLLSPHDVPQFGLEGATLWSRLAVLTGMLLLSALVCTVILPSRLRSLNRAFGIESVIEVHRFLGVVSAVLVLAHLACVIAENPANVALLYLPTAPGRAQCAIAACASLVGMVLLAALKHKLSLSYELWRRTHLLLAAGVVGFSAGHVYLLNRTIQMAPLTTMYVLVTAVLVAVFGYRWAWRAWVDPSTEFVVREVRPESATVSTLVLEPKPGPDQQRTGTWAFAPGQFAWIRLDRSVMSEEHPFTIASSAHAETTEFTIRHAGDFTSAVRQLPPGSPIWVDGPHGAFTGDHSTGSALVLLAGGVGLTPMMSMIRTAAHRGDPRAYRLIAVASAPSDLLFRDELAELRRHLDLEITEVLRRPTKDWAGPVGGISVDLLAMVLRTVRQPDNTDFFICGPPGMVSDAMAVLHDLGVGAGRVHTEQFDFV